MRIRVKVLKDHPYSKGLKVGDTYEVSGQSQLGLVKAMGWAEEAPEPAAAPIQTRAMVSPAVKTAVRAKRGSYLTRDMTAAPLIDNATKVEPTIAQRAEDMREYRGSGMPPVEE